VLGLVLERVAGCSHAEALRRNVLGPCAMTGSEPVTTAAAQARAPTGHLELPDGARVPAPWVPTAAGSGATLCTAPTSAGSCGPWSPATRRCWGRSSARRC
jgi:CubicO group peptidase (beta-lactamase class C family)